MTRSTSQNFLIEGLIISFLLALVACGGGDNEKHDGTAYGSCNNTPNYLSDISFGRWRELPITVFIDWQSAPQYARYSTAYQRAVTKGLMAWNVGDGVGSSILISDISRADLIVSFSHSMPNIYTYGMVIHGPRSQGSTDPYFQKGTNLFLNYTVFDNILSTIISNTFENTLSKVIAHEMGHVLFSVGHPKSTTDLMSASAASSELSRSDINSIREVYCRP